MRLFPVFQHLFPEGTFAGLKTRVPFLSPLLLSVVIARGFFFSLHFHTSTTEMRKRGEKRLRKESNTRGVTTKIKTKEGIECPRQG